VVVTSDKCYENREWVWPYREQDVLGGLDPYSNSKACIELLCSSYRASFLQSRGVALATARAGNVLGGGDWSPERLIPDILRAWQQGESLTLRYPQATRPWQHVLEPLYGYLLLAQALVEQGEAAASAWNFGPDAEGIASVGEVVEQLARQWVGSVDWTQEAEPQPHEAGLLALDSSKARRLLGWNPRWSLQRTLEQTLVWHRAWQAGQDMQAFTRAQIVAYQGDIQ
jgi:CDP-glucose 4,6-dehydratase